MIIICIRTLILYVIVLFALRVMGKAELSKASTFQMVILFMIAELASIPIDEPSASLINGVIAILTLLFLQVLFSLLSIKSETFKRLVNGRPSIIVEQGRINVKELERLRVSINELFEQLRIGDCPSLSDVEYAVMEDNGELSIIKTADHEHLPIVLVSDGRVYEENLATARLDRRTLLHMLEAKGLSDPSKVFLAFYDGQHQFHVYPYPSPMQHFTKEVE